MLGRGVGPGFFSSVYSPGSGTVLGEYGMICGEN